MAFITCKTGLKRFLSSGDFAVSTARMIPSTVPRKSPEITLKREVATESQKELSAQSSKSLLKTERGDGTRIVCPTARYAKCHKRIQKATEAAEQRAFFKEKVTPFSKILRVKISYKNLRRACFRQWKRGLLQRARKGSL